MKAKPKPRGRNGARPVTVGADATLTARVSTADKRYIASLAGTVSDGIRILIRHHKGS